MSSSGQRNIPIKVDDATVFHHPRLFRTFKRCTGDLWSREIRLSSFPGPESKLSERFLGNKIRLRMSLVDLDYKLPLKRPEPILTAGIMARDASTKKLTDENCGIHGYIRWTRNGNEWTSLKWSGNYLSCLNGLVGIILRSSAFQEGSDRKIKYFYSEKDLDGNIMRVGTACFDPFEWLTPLTHLLLFTMTTIGQNDDKSLG